jgi:hypothetical protein
VIGDTTQHFDLEVERGIFTVVCIDSGRKRSM